MKSQKESAFKLISVLLCIITLLSCNPSFAQEQEGLPPKIANFIEKLESKKSSLQGGAIAILHKGQVVYKSTFGKKQGDVGDITEYTLFPLASVSKAVSATAIALMVDQGHLNWNEAFTLPYLKNPVKLSHILSHTTGYHFSGNAEIEQGLPRKKILNVMQKQKPTCKPGQCYRYSNTLFSLVEDALNQKQLSLNFAINNMLTTLGIEDIQMVPLPSNTNVAYPHCKKIKEGKETIIPLPFPPYYPKTVPASAGIFASLNGMIEVFKLSFGYRPDLISEQTLDRMHTPLKLNKDIFKWNIHLPFDGKNIESYYALGWRILKLKNRINQDLIFHSGYINGINSFIGFIPSEETGIIILLNQASPFPIQQGFQFWKELLD